MIQTSMRFSPLKNRKRPPWPIRGMTCLRKIGQELLSCNYLSESGPSFTGYYESEKCIKQESRLEEAKIISLDVSLSIFQ